MRGTSNLHLPLRPQKLFQPRFIIIAILLIAASTSFRVWRADIDLCQLISPRRAVDRSVDDAVGWIPTRDPVNLYQNGQAVATIQNATIDEAKRTVTFGKVEKSLKLDILREFEFQKYRLRYKSVETTAEVGGLAMRADRVFGNMVCEIVGTRSAF